MLARFAAIAALLVSSPAGADPDRVSFLLGSHHFGARRDFNEFNPGVFLTWERDSADFSVGVYSNSYGRTSVAATVAVRLLDWESGNLSAFVGVANYPEDGRTFSVHWGDVVPIGGVQFTHGNLFVQAIPSDGSYADAIIDFGVTYPIRR